MNVLVTGGAGYIGSVVVEELVNNGHRVIVLDNLSQGHLDAVDKKALFFKADVDNKQVLDNIFSAYQIDAVLHLAALISVEYSMKELGTFFWNNTVCGITLLEKMAEHKVKKLIFSSTAALYGNPDEMPVTEKTAVNPISIYGESKLLFERILRWYDVVHGIKYVAFRYFNVAGASKKYGGDHNPETLLIPSAIKVALNQMEYLPVYGNDYHTGDGTCIRDYIHVLDISHAHILALDYLLKDIPGNIYNLGNGRGYSVMEVIETARKVTGAPIPIKIFPRRAGDIPVLITSSDLAERELGWKPEYPQLDTIINDAWQWQKQYPHGYER